MSIAPLLPPLRAENEKIKAQLTTLKGEDVGGRVVVVVCGGRVLVGNEKVVGQVAWEHVRGRLPVWRVAESAHIRLAIP